MLCASPQARARHSHEFQSIRQIREGPTAMGKVQAHARPHVFQILLTQTLSLPHQIPVRRPAMTRLLSRGFGWTQPTREELNKREIKVWAFASFPSRKSYRFANAYGLTHPPMISSPRRSSDGAFLRNMFDLFSCTDLRPSAGK